MIIHSNGFNTINGLDMMNRIKMPSNKKKRLYKMAKHLGNPQERWWLLAPDLLSYDQWVEKIGDPMGTTEFQFTEEGIRQWVDGLYGMGQHTARAYWLSIYQQIYIPLVNASVQSAIDGGFGLKTLSSVYVGTRNFPVWTDCWIAPCGATVFTEARATDDVGARLPSVLRSAFRPAPSVDMPAWMMAEYYASRSLHYAEKFGLSLSDCGEGWSLGDVTEGVDMASLQAVLASDGEVVGRGLIEWVVYDNLL